MEKDRMRGYPRDDIERAAAHWGISPEQVTEAHLRALPERGYGLERGTAAGLSGNPSIITAATGAGIGAMIWGPIGAAIGAVIGTKLGERL